MKKYAIYTRVLALVVLGLLGLALPGQVSAATLYLTSTATSIPLGGVFTVYVNVNTAGADTNSYQVNLNFPSHLVKPIAASTGGSVCSLFPQPASYTTVSASVSCGLPSPGYNGGGGRIVAVTLQTLAQGSGTINFGASQVLANDGMGTNVLYSTQSLSFTVTEPPPAPVATPQITASSGDSGRWVNVSNVDFSWNTPAGAVGFNYILTTDKSQVVPRQSKGIVNSISLGDLPEGMSYFKVAAVSDRGQWSADAEFVLQIDRSGPSDLELVVDPSGEEIEKLPLLAFNALDGFSGIDKYELSIDGGDFFQVDNSYQFTEISSGEHSFKLRVTDKVGNSSEKEVKVRVKQVSKPSITHPAAGSTLPLSEVLEVRGSAVPGGLVRIYIDDTLVGEVKADEQGGFVFRHSQLIFPGGHKVYAQAQNPGGIWSEKSEGVEIMIDAYAISIGGRVWPSLIVLAIALVILAVLIFFILFLIKRLRDEDRENREEVERLEKEVYLKTKRLEGTLTSSLANLLKKARSKRTNKEEVSEQVINEIGEDLDQFEKEVKQTFKGGT